MASPHLAMTAPGFCATFLKRVGLGYTLLSDPESKVIRAFGILNEEVPKDRAIYGIPHPGMYIIDAKGIVTAKFFEEKYQDRYTPATILHSIDSQTGLVFGSSETDHLKVTLSASDRNVRLGNRITLILRIELKPGMHVYAPEVEGGYKPIRWELARHRPGPLTKWSSRNRRCSTCPRSRKPCRFTKARSSFRGT